MTVLPIWAPISALGSPELLPIQTSLLGQASGTWAKKATQDRLLHLPMTPKLSWTERS